MRTRVGYSSGERFGRSFPNGPGGKHSPGVRSCWRAAVLGMFVWGIVAAWLCAPPELAAQSFGHRSERQRRERLERMDAAEKEKLLRQKERFEQLSPEERQRLHKVHETLTQAPDGEKLFGVLQRYCEWLKTLSPAERAELLAMPSDKRVARIQELLQVQEEQRLRRLANLSWEEGVAVRDWFIRLITPHEDELWGLLSPESQEFINARADDPDQRRRMMVWSLLFRHHQGAKLRQYLALDEAAVTPLLNQLSPERREEFRKLRNLDQQRDLLGKWLAGAIGGRPSFRASEAELQEFFVRELSRDKQAELEMMPREQMQRELRRLYFAHKFARAPGWGPPERGPQRPPGPPGEAFPRRPREDDKAGRDKSRASFDPPTKIGTPNQD